MQLLLHDLKRAFLGLVSSINQMLERLLAKSMLLLADDTTLVAHQILLLQTTGCVLGVTIPDLRLAADSRNLFCGSR